MNELEKFPYLEQEMDRLLQEIGSRPDDESLALAAYSSVKNRLGISGLPYMARKAARWTMRIAAILFVPAVIGLSALISTNRSISRITWSEITVPDGQTREITLPDGSDIVLNSGSRLTFPSKFSKKSRDVFFDGEVFAKVEKDAKRPFIIHSRGIDVKVFGTTFDFKSYDYADYAELLLLDGSVRMDVEKDGAVREYTLKPGNLIQYQRSTGEVDRKDINVRNYKPFNEDRSVHFYNIPMKEIALELEKRFKTRIVIKDAKLEQTKFLAFFTDNETLDDIIDSFCADNTITATRSENIIFLQTKTHSK